MSHDTASVTGDSRVSLAHMEDRPIDDPAVVAARASAFANGLAALVNAQVRAMAWQRAALAVVAEGQDGGADPQTTARQALTRAREVNARVMRSLREVRDGFGALHVQMDDLSEGLAVSGQADGRQALAIVLDGCQVLLGPATPGVPDGDGRCAA